MSGIFVECVPVYYVEIFVDMWRKDRFGLWHVNTFVVVLDVLQTCVVNVLNTGTCSRHSEYNRDPEMQGGDPLSTVLVPMLFRMKSYPMKGENTPERAQPSFSLSSN